MQRTTQKERDEFVANVMKHAPAGKPNERAALAWALLDLAPIYGRIQETACNRSLTTEEARTEVRTEESIRGIAKELGCGVQFGGDPRGYTVKLMFPDGHFNTWGGKESGFGVCGS